MDYVTNTSYGTWNNHVDKYATGLEHSVMEAFGSYGADGYDFDAIVDDYRNEINAALPDSVALSGDQFIGPAHTEDDAFEGYPLSEYGTLDITAIVESIDLQAIMDRHEQLTIDQVAEQLGYKTETAKGAARKRLSAWGVKAVAHKPHPESGRVQAYYNAQQVRAAKEARPGRGVGGGRKAQA